MAELLIYNATHWMDKLSSEQWEHYRAKHANWEAKYAGRWQKGQVVEIRPDGFWSQAGLYPRRDLFRVLLLPGVKPEDVRYLLAEGNHERRRYVVNSGAAAAVATVTDVRSLSVTDKEGALG
jgi:hypothetical protein